MKTIAETSIDMSALSDQYRDMDLNQKDQLKKAMPEMMRRMMNEMLAESTVHGVRYLNEPKRHWLERVWWAIAFSLSVSACIISTLNIWNQWNDRPVVVTIDDQMTSIKTIPLPAVTICPEQQLQVASVNRKKFEKIHKVLTQNLSAPSQFSPDDIREWDTIAQICYMKMDSNATAANDSLQQNEAIYEHANRLSFDPDETFPFVKRFSSDRSMKTNPVYTYHGLCRTFNSINSNELYSDAVTSRLKTVTGNPKATWNVDDGYQLNVDENDVYPNRMFGSGISDSLVIWMGIYRNILVACGRASYGFRLSIHLPDELNFFQSKFIPIAADSSVLISIKPKMIKTSQGLRSYTPHKRGCYYENERQLRLFKSYSRHKCKLECLLDFIRHKCDCVHFSMPRDNVTRICTIFDTNCYNSAENVFNSKPTLEDCDCLPSCTSITFEAEKSEYHKSGSWNFEEYFSKSRFQSASSIYMSFEEDEFYSLVRSETTTMSGFIASCGGLLGLFMGISVLSIVELVYFLTLRPCCKFRQQQIVDSVTTKTQAWA